MPLDYFEIARTLFAGISAAAAAVGIWQKERDSKKAAHAFDVTFTTTRESAQAKDAASELVTIIPHEVIGDLEKRAESCWTGYRSVLGGDFLPGEVDHATVSVRACVCRELRRIYDLNGDIPDRWRGQWNRYECHKR